MNDMKKGDRVIKRVDLKDPITEQMHSHDFGIDVDFGGQPDTCPQ